MTDQEIHGMLLERLNRLKSSAKPPKKKRLKVSELVEETGSADEDANEVEDEIAEESDQSSDNESADFDE